MLKQYRTGHGLVHKLRYLATSNGQDFRMGCKQKNNTGQGIAQTRGSTLSMFV